MTFKVKEALNKHVDPVVVISKDYGILFANTAAKALWGDEAGKKCYQFIYKRPHRCPLCVGDDLQANKRSATVRRCRFVKDAKGKDEERYSVVTPLDLAGQVGECHFEVFTPVPETILATRAIMAFAERIERLEDPDAIFETLVGFLSSDETNLRCRTRCYSLERNDHSEEFRLIYRDHRADAHPYVDDIDTRVIPRGVTVDFNASFACVDQSRWFILTPESDKAEAFKIHFRATARANPPELWHADMSIAQQPISLYLYEKNRDGIVGIFKGQRHHTFLDIPIRTKKKTYGKISITLWEYSFLFYREHIEELRLIDKFVTRRLEAIESLEETKAAVAQNVIHEVAQPAFAGLASMEALRRRDRENGKTAADEQVDFYLKKNVECSLKMVAFLNDRGRIGEDIPSYSDTRTNFLSDVVAPVVNLTRFGIYAKHLRDTGERLNPKELEDIPVRQFRTSNSVRSVFRDVIYEISYSDRCDGVTVYIEKYRLQQVLYNLLNNALKYKGKGCNYRVGIQYRYEMTIRETELFADYYVIDVTDEGYGVDTGEQETIFDLCVQGRHARKVSSVPGTGRGLYVCRAIIRGVGGDVFVQNLRDPTVFRVLIPRACKSSRWKDEAETLREKAQEVMRRVKEGA